MDGLIFVALAVAWAVYLVPKALKHHDEVVRSRPVDEFSDRVRVVARREATDGARATFVVPRTRRPGGEFASRAAAQEADATATAAEDSTAEPAAAPVATVGRTARLRRGAGALLARFSRTSRRPRTPLSPAARRRRVLSLLLVGLVSVVGVAAVGAISWWWTAAPVALVLGWLVACRLMVKSASTRRRATTTSQPTAGPAAPPVPHGEAQGLTGVMGALDESGAPVVVQAEGSWDLRPMTLPTYVTAPAAERGAARGLDLDSTGVWTSGRSEADSALAREAAQVEKAEKASAEERRARRVSGA